MRDIYHFQENENYSLRSGSRLSSRNMRTKLFGKEMVSNLGAKIWLLFFKNKLKEWKPTNCSCRLCKTYIQHIRF